MNILQKTLGIVILLLIINNLNAQDMLITDGLVGYWPFNGNANDESENENHGIVNGARISLDRHGNPNSAYSFDGIDDYIDLGKNSSFRQSLEITYSFWFYIPSNSEGGEIMGAGCADGQGFGGGKCYFNKLQIFLDT